VDANESEMGFTPEEAVTALRRSFGREGWACEAQATAEGVAQFSASAPDGSAVQIEIRRLPDRTIGPTICLPRSSMRVEIQAAPHRRPGIAQTIRVSLHRGGG
jgi:hypothetical protein